MLRSKSALVILLIAALILAVLMLHPPPLLRTGNRDVGTHVIESLVYPSNATYDLGLAKCHVLVDETKPKLRIETRTVVVTMLPNGTAVETTTTVHTPPSPAREVYGGSERLLPIVIYVCSGGTHIVEFTKLEQVNVSKIMLTIMEYRAPVPEDYIKCFIDKSGELYAGLINGSRIRLRKSIDYSVNVDSGGYIIMKKDRRAVVKILLTLSYKDGYIRQYGTEFLRQRIEYICLDSNCTITIPP